MLCIILLLLSCTQPEVVPPVTTETVGQLVQALLRAQQDQEKKLIVGL